jgi:hypothetical protein
MYLLLKYIVHTSISFFFTQMKYEIYVDICHPIVVAEFRHQGKNSNLVCINSIPFKMY